MVKRLCTSPDEEKSPCVLQISLRIPCLPPCPFTSQADYPEKNQDALHPPETGQDSPASLRSNNRKMSGSLLCQSCCGLVGEMGSSCRHGLSCIAWEGTYMNLQIEAQKGEMDLGKDAG